MKNNVIRLSHIITQDVPSYGNRDFVKFKKKSSIIDGDTANTSIWYFSNNHVGTHIDSPYHFDENGKKTYDITIEDFIFNKVVVIDVPLKEGILISTDFLFKNIPHDIELLLIRTGYEQFRQKDKYWNDNPGIAPEVADFLRRSFPKLRCIGFDFISLTSWNHRKEGRESHKQFLCPENGGKEILIIEDMTLIQIRNPIHKVIVAPLFCEDGNGGAVTIFAEIG